MEVVALKLLILKENIMLPMHTTHIAIVVHDNLAVIYVYLYLYELVKACMAVSTIRKIKHEACTQDANKARGKAECFIGIKVARRVLYFTYSKS